MNKLVILIHGWGNNGESAFFGKLKRNLEEKGYFVLNPNLINSDNQKFEESYSQIENLIINNLDKEISIVGHSSGGYLALKIAESFKLNKMISVAPVCPKDYLSDKRLNDIHNWLKDEQLNNYLNFFSKEINFDKILKNCNSIDLLFGLKDPYIDQKNRDFYIKRLDNTKAKIHIFKNYGHMGSSDGIESLEEVESIFL